MAWYLSQLGRLHLASSLVWAVLGMGGMGFLLLSIFLFSSHYLYFLYGWPTYTSCLANQCFIKIHDWQNTDISPIPNDGSQYSEGKLYFLSTLSLSFFTFSILLHLWVCVDVSVCRHVHAKLHMWRSEDDCVESVTSTRVCYNRPPEPSQPPDLSTTDTTIEAPLRPWNLHIDSTTLQYENKDLIHPGP